MTAPEQKASLAQERVREIFRRYRDSLAAQLDVIDDAALAALAGPLDSERRAQAHRAAHKLAGSAGTFGFAEATTIARQVEHALAPQHELGPREVLTLSERAVALRAALPLGDETPRLPEPLREVAGTRERDAPVLLLVEPDARLREELAALAVQAGFAVDHAAGAEDAHALLQGPPPAVVVLAIPAAPTAQTTAMLRQLAVRQVPVVALGSQDRFEDRVELARLGVRGYLPRPVTASSVLEAVQRVLDRVQLDNMTVLAVDDDPAVLAALTALLEAEGLTVVPLDDPQRFWATLEDCAPDLLILDLDMPGVTGLDLCRVVRGHARWSQLPVLFLTATTDPEVARQIFAAGADDYVAKPLSGPELVMRIANRLERLSLYRRLAETDPLTGVANRRSAMDDLGRLLRVAARSGAPLSVALLDLDHFKAVNDEHGHVAGDAVLRALGAHLLNAFRNEDVVARWGGEEFLVGLHGSRAADAVVRLRQVLHDFEQRSFLSPAGVSFGAAFSAGVAEHPVDGADLAALYRAADTALYAAKRAGRRTVVAAGSEACAEATATVVVDVVVVEDDEALAPLLMHSLDLRGLSTLWLREGDAAAAQLTGSPPAVRARVVVLDWDLPGLDGAAVLRRLVEGGALNRTRVIMLTARSREDEVLRVLELGAADHVPKPFSLPVLLERIRRQLGPDRAW